MDVISCKYNSLCIVPSDINEHLPTLSKYASECESIIELGVRGVVSTYAFINGLLNNGRSTRKLFLNDIETCDIGEVERLTADLDIDIDHEWINDLELEVKENYDLTFIDTWHVYGQLKRELAKYSQVTNKYIIMHDTTCDAIYGETVRNQWSAEQQSKDSGIPVEEILKGLAPAISEFLEANKNWKIRKVYNNNNGLTILERTDLEGTSD